MEIYRNIGELTIRVYPSLLKLRADLPTGANPKCGGYYDKRTKTIYTVDLTRVLLHEIKHYLEPSWKHKQLVDVKTFELEVDHV